MKVAIVGSRTINDYELIKKYIIENYILEEISEIISGGAKGVDSLANRFANEFSIPITNIIPNWNLGRSAGYKRNLEIIDLCDMCIAFWDGESKGTKHDIDICRNKNKKCDIVIIKKNDD